MVTEKLRRSVPVLFSAVFGTATLAALATFVGGCENPTSQADKSVTQKVETARAENDKTHDRKKLINDLEAAAKVPNATPTSKVAVKLEQARQEVDAADALARDAGADEIEIARLAGQVQSLTAQIAANNLLIDGLNQRKPDEALKGVDDAMAAAKGSGDTATWGPADKGVPAGSAVDAEIARINADIQKLTSEKSTLDTQQKQNTDDARKLEEQAAKARGKEARDAGIKAAGLRRDARTATMRMEQIDRSVASLQDRLKVDDARKTALADADKAYQDRKSQISAGWDELKKQVDIYQGQSKKLLEGNGDAREQSTGTSAPATAPSTQPRTYDAANPPTDDDVTRLGLLLQAELGKYDTDRKNALEKYEAANNYVKDAQTQAEQLVKGLPKQISEKEASKGLTELYAPSAFKLRLAAIRLKAAQVHAEQADTVSVLDGARTALSAALEKAGLQMPAEFSALPAGSTVADLRKQAGDEFSDADTILDDIGQTGAKNDQNFARQLQVAERYARAKDAARAGDTAKADSELTNARTILQTLNTESPLADSLYLTPELASAIRTPPKLPPLAATGGPPPATGPSTPGNVFTPAPTATVPADWVVHNVGTTGVTIKSPPSWQEIPPQDLQKLQQYGIKAGAVIILAPPDLSASMNIVTAALPAGSPSMDALLPTVTEGLKSAIPNFQLVTSEMGKVGAYPAGKIVYDATPNGKPVRLEQHELISGGQLYSFTFTTSADQYPTLAPMFQQICDTLQLPGGPTAPTTPVPAPSDTTTPPATPATPAAPEGTTPPATPTAPATPDTGTTPATPATPATSPAPDAPK
jgi:hypothetical protein